MPRKQKKQKEGGDSGRAKYCNKQQIGHLVNNITHAVQNMESMEGEEDRKTLRHISRSLHLTSVGVRTLYQQHEMVVQFKELTMWSDLLTPSQLYDSAVRYLAYAAKADQRAKAIHSSNMALAEAAAGKDKSELGADPSSESDAESTTAYEGALGSSGGGSTEFHNSLPPEGPLSRATSDTARTAR